MGAAISQASGLTHNSALQPACLFCTLKHGSIFWKIRPSAGGGGRGASADVFWRENMKLGIGKNVKMEE
jgi:hypothetical protein